MSPTPPTVVRSAPPRPFLLGAALLVTALVAAVVAVGRPADAQVRGCDAPDARSTVWFLDTDSGVPNRAIGDCTLNDLIDDERTWERHSLFVRAVAETSRSLRADGVISGREHGALVSAAARSEVGKTSGYEVIFDGTAESFADWAYAGNGGFDLMPDGTIQSRAGEDGGFGTLWYPEEAYGDFSLRLQFRDDAPGGPDVRANSGVQVRFPPLYGPVEGCPTTFNGNEQNNLSWIAVNCGHEIQINDSPTGDPRKTGSIYGFDDLSIAEANPTPKGVWNDLEIRVVGQHYTVIRNGEVINEYENVPGVHLEGRPNDPDSSARGLIGYLGLQAHGAPQDVVSFRNIRVRELNGDD